jgi:hypothetical protein
MRKRPKSQRTDQTRICDACRANTKSCIFIGRVFQIIHLPSRRFPGKRIGRGERIRTSGLYVPNVALYQAKLHPAYSVPSHSR